MGIVEGILLCGIFTRRGGNALGHRRTGLFCRRGKASCIAIRGRRGASQITRGRGTRRITRGRGSRRGGAHGAATRSGIESGVTIEDEIVSIAILGASAEKYIVAALPGIVKMLYGSAFRHKITLFMLWDLMSGHIVRRHGCPLRCGKIFKRYAFGRFFFHLCPIGFTCPFAACIPNDIARYRRVEHEKRKRSKRYEGKEHVGSCRGEQQADGIANKPEEDSSARATHSTLGCRRPATGKVFAEFLSEEALRRSDMYDEKHAYKKENATRNPTGRENAFANDKPKSGVDE